MHVITFIELEFEKSQFKKRRNFPGGPVVKIPCFHCRAGLGSIPAQATRFGMPPDVARQYFFKKKKRGGGVKKQHA